MKNRNEDNAEITIIQAIKSINWNETGRLRLNRKFTVQEYNIQVNLY